MKKNIFNLVLIFLFIFASCGTTEGTFAGNELETETKQAQPRQEAAVEIKIEPEPVTAEDPASEIVIDDPLLDIAELVLDEELQAGDNALLPDEYEAEPLIEETPPAPQEPPVVQTPPSSAPPAPVAQSDPAPLPEIKPEVTEIAQETLLPDSLSEEISDDTFTEISRETYRPSFPSGPARTPDSILQMGLTPLDREIIFSRIIHAAVGQTVEIPFRGSGWIYLGETASKRGIVYSSRRNDPEGQSFIFTLEAPETYVLKFYRQDFIRDYIINDHVQVIVTEAPSGSASWQNQPADRSRVVAQPRWPTAVEEAQIRSGSRITTEPVVTAGEATLRETSPAQPPLRETPSRETPSSGQRVMPAQPAVTAPPSQQTPPRDSAVSAPFVQAQPPEAISEQSRLAESLNLTVREKLPYDDTVKKAKENFDAGNTQAAITLLEQLIEDYPGGSDELYWQLGQYYEANSPSRNILLSIDYYRRLVNEYPQSSRHNDARRRIAYLERFYINIQ
ncbi:MAG: tetratricopeptide repeat protein [Treponema sp.]|nr:tetratricopeptide repeat protein [Treponema sp.]